MFLHSQSLSEDVEQDALRENVHAAYREQAWAAWGSWALCSFCGLRKPQGKLANGWRGKVS
eukprot:11211506-Lingulodinium_polyedra.AAC.1